MRTVFALILAAVLTGCAIHDLNMKPFAATGDALQQTKAYINGAEQGVQALKPHVDPAGAAIVPLITQSHQNATRSLDVASAALIQAQAVAQNAQKQTADAQAKYQKIYHSWGYQAELWIRWAIWIIIIVYAVHVLSGVAAFVLPMIFPATLPAVPILSMISKVTNVPGYITWLAGHAHANYLLKAQATALAAVAK